MAQFNFVTKKQQLFLPDTHWHTCCFGVFFSVVHGVGADVEKRMDTGDYD